MIGLFENRRMARWCAVLLAVLAVWVLIADERYASLLRTEKECISALMQKTGVEFPQDLYSLARYQYKACRLSDREWGVLEEAFIYPARLIRELR
jgi:hypothetical protein